MTLISEAMLIMIQYSKPFNPERKNFVETFNEVSIIIVVYHMIIVSDFVPENNNQLKIWSGYSMVVYISTVSLIYLIKIIFEIFSGIFVQLKTAVNERLYPEEKIDKEIKNEIDFLLRKMPHLETTICLMENTLE